MNRSDQLDQIAPALVAAQKAVKPASKSAQNTHLKNKYATLGDVWDACRDALASNGLAAIQSADQSDDAAITVSTTILHSSGQWVSGDVRLPLEKPTAQAAGSAITYGRRYGLSSMLGIVADEDDDGNAAAGPGRSQAQAPTPRAAPAPQNGDTGAERGDDAPTEKQVLFFQRLAESPVFSETERKRALEWLTTKATRQTIKDQIDWLKHEVETRRKPAAAGQS